MTGDDHVIKILRQKAAVYREKAERIEKLLFELNGIFDDSEAEISEYMVRIKPSSLLETIVLFLKKWKADGNNGATTEQVRNGIRDLGYTFKNPSVKMQMQLIRSTVSRYRKKDVFARSIDGKIRLDKSFESKDEGGGHDK